MDVRHTAAAIARVRHKEGTRTEGERLFVDPYAALFDDTSIDVQQLFAAVPFFEEHIRLRTRFFDDAARDAVARGASHVVLVGAGFDARALRMPELAGVRVVEVDHADQIAAKQRRFAEARVTIPANVSFAPADLMEPGALARGLEAAGLRGAQQVLWICEGLFGYLSLPSIAELARTTASLSASGSTLVANHGVLAWNPAVIADAFASNGWNVDAPPSFDALHRRWLGPEPPAGSEQFALLTARR